jgi:hypothetical protein
MHEMERLLTHRVKDRPAERPPWICGKIPAALAFLLLVALTRAAFGWELELRGETVWRYRYLARAGDMDIFGSARGWPKLGVNNLHTYPSLTSNSMYGSTFGVIAGEPGFGADKDLNDFLVTLYPKIKVNSAVEVRGKINLTSMGIHSGGRPYDLTAGTPGMVNELWVPIGNRPASVNVPNTFVTVEWWGMFVKTPMVDLAFGLRFPNRGIGLVQSPCERGGTAFTITARYGPFLTAFSPYIARQGSTLGGVGDRDSGSGNNLWRKDAHRDYLRLPATWSFRYETGPWSFIVNCDGSSVLGFSTGPGSYVPRTLSSAAAPATAMRYAAAHSRPAHDELKQQTHVALKYFDGTSFFNGEAVHIGRWASGAGAAAVAPAGGGLLEKIDADRDAWVYGVEFGSLFGPLKTTLSYIRATGDDPNTRKTDEEAAVADQGVMSCYVQYWAYLMYYYYGAGVAWDGSGKGTPSNFHHVGVRLDYAAASNLNVFGVFSHAWRDQPNAFQLAGNWLAGAQRFSNDTILSIKAAGGAQTAANHQAVPDHARSMGWEINAGWDWKILENLTWNLTVALWKPGNWWAFAYPNTAMLYRAQPRDGTALAAGTFAQAAADLGRDIDPLVALEMSLRIEF